MTPLAPVLRRPVRPRASEPANVYVETATRRLRENPDDPDALFALAAWLAVSGRPSDAIGLLRRLTRIDPGYPGVWRVMANVYRQLGDEAKARECEGTSDRYWA